MVIAIVVLILFFSGGIIGLGFTFGEGNANLRITDIKIKLLSEFPKIFQNDSKIDKDEFEKLATLLRRSHKPIEFNPSWYQKIALRAMDFVNVSIPEIKATVRALNQHVYGGVDLDAAFARIPDSIRKD